MKARAILAWAARLAATTLSAVTALAAAPVERDLGQGLAYYRIHQLPDDLPTAEGARHKPCVLDLRYVGGDSKAAAALSAWVKFHAARTTPVFLLMNADTAKVLVRALSDHETTSGIMTVGVAAGGFQPDSAVQTTPENEKRAYEALEQGASLATLLMDNPDKARNDEASLAKDRSEVPVEESAEARRRGKRAAVDATLQRAVHLHRALVALKKI